MAGQDLHSHPFIEYVTKQIENSEKNFLKPEYLHLHENDIGENLGDYKLLNYIYRFITGIPNLKDNLESLVCCYCYEEESRTLAEKCKRDRFYYFRITDFRWQDLNSFIAKHEHYTDRPTLVNFSDTKGGLIDILKDMDVVQPYILMEKNKAIEPIFIPIYRPESKNIKSLLNKYQQGNSYQSAWYGYKFKHNYDKKWRKKPLTDLLVTGFIHHVIEWNMDLKAAHESSQLEFHTLINISTHVYKTAIKTDILSEIDTIENDDNRESLARLKENARHLFVLTGIVNLLTKFKFIDEFVKTAEKDDLFSRKEVAWNIREIVQAYSKSLLKRKGFSIAIETADTVIPGPPVTIYNLHFSEHLIRSFLHTILENVELHGLVEDFDEDNQGFRLWIESTEDEWVFRNKSKEKFSFQEHKLTGNLMLYKSLIEKTASGEMKVSCVEQKDDVYFELRIKSKMKRNE